MTAADGEIEELIGRAAAGDRDARARLIDHHRDHLRRMIAVRLDRRLAARVDASDVVQDVLVDADRRLEEFLRDRPLPFLGWLRQLAAERLIDTHRRHVASQRRSVAREQPGSEPPAGSADELARNLADSLSSPSQKAMREERIERVRAALAALPSRDREVLVMRHLEHLAIDEIAAALGLTEGAVKARILRALVRMRDALGTPP